MSNFSNTPITTLYYLLYGRYGNSHIASSDENQFKYKLFSIIFQYGPAWAKKLQIQEKLFNIDLSTDAILEGTTQIYNHAENPDTNPANSTATSIQYKIISGVSSQNSTTTKRGKLEGYELLRSLIENDVTEEFLSKFKKLFLKVVTPEEPLWYQSIGDHDDEDLMVVNSLYGNYRTNTFQEIWEKATDFTYDYNNCGIPTTI